MSSACPYCFTPISPSEIFLRCTGGCAEVPDPQASAYAGYEMNRTPFYRETLRQDVKVLPSAVKCRRCQSMCVQEICGVCHRDLPQGWRDANVFTMAITGARGAGKSVYIAVMVNVLRRYAQERACTVQPYTRRTHDAYNAMYYRPLFKENVAMEGTHPLGVGASFESDPLIWEVSGARSGRLYIVMRDVPGEDMENLTGRPPAFSFHDRADLVIFLFDPILLDSVRQVLSGIIPDVDKGRLGARSGEVLPAIMGLMESGRALLALTISKFDSLHQLPQAMSPMAPALANPAAHINRDDTMILAGMQEPDAGRALMDDLDFLDAEVRSLFQLIGEKSVTLLAEQAKANRQIHEYRHFAVSAVGESPRHKGRLTERGISPFRVLDPVLWGMHVRGLSL